MEEIITFIFITLLSDPINIKLEGIYKLIFLVIFLFCYSTKIKYRLEEGGFSIVFLVKDPDNNKFACKVIRPNLEKGLGNLSF